MNATSLIVIFVVISAVAGLIILLSSFTGKEEDDRPVLSEDEQRKAYQEEKKEREWADTSEGVKFVCKGGKVQCKYCSSPIVDILPTSTEVMLQDKPYVTVGDKDGKVNFNFTGLCTHSSHGSKKPPCKSVINLGDWKDYSQTMIDNYNALLVKSKIPCMVSGEYLEIVDSGQRSELVSASPDQERVPRIIDMYWMDKDETKIIKHYKKGEEVVLYVVTEEFDPETPISIPFNVEENGEKTTLEGIVGSDGIAKIRWVNNNKN